MCSSLSIDDSATFRTYNNTTYTFFIRHTEEDAEQSLQANPLRRNLQPHGTLVEALRRCMAALGTIDPSRGYLAAVSYNSPMHESAFSRHDLVALNGLDVQEAVAERYLLQHLEGSTQGPSRFQQMLTAPGNTSRLSFSLWDAYNAFPLALRRAVGKVVEQDGGNIVVRKSDKKLEGTVHDLGVALRVGLTAGIHLINVEEMAPILQTNPSSNSYRNRRDRLVSPSQTSSPRPTRVETLVIYLGSRSVSLICPFLVSIPFSLVSGRSYGGPLGVGQDAQECEQEYTGRFLRINNRKRI